MYSVFEDIMMNIANIRLNSDVFKKHICRVESHARFDNERFDAMFPSQRDFAGRVRIQNCYG